ncbi:MAG TPA: RNA-binding domain-containing protein [Nitrosopumilaceae archaeon]|nr:RNA-binding domain-containing protein [Nitrosopumilaceae archaeon]
MNIPDVPCKIDVYCSINPSEDPKKVKQAITNILFDVDVEINKESLKATSTNLESLEKIYESIHSHQSKNAYRRQLNQNLRDDSSWFYLNKQAAFVNTIALCSESEESPLGPIKIVLISKNIDAIIEWLVFN